MLRRDEDSTDDMAVVDMAAAVGELDGALRAMGSDERADGEKRYLKSDLEFYGVGVPATRRAVKELLAAHALDRAQLIDAVETLWAEPVHERRLAAVLLLDGRQGLLDARDLPLIERLLRDSKTWALVDVIAASVAGPLIDRSAHPEETLDRWAVDEDFWIRRSALLAHLGPLRAGGGDFDRFGRYADAMLEDKEFFIRKAIGWVLRDTARRRPSLVYDWLAPRAHRASGVTVREAVKRLPEPEAERVMEAYRTRTPIGPGDSRDWGRRS